MKVIAVLQADLEVTPLGTRSRLTQELGGTAILRRTVDRIRPVPNVSGTVVLCPATQRPRVERILAESGAEVLSIETGASTWEPLIRSARKWSLDGWRGGIGGATSFDEYTDCRRLERLLAVINADAFLSIPPAAPFFDSELARRMIEHRKNLGADVRLVFTQAPPGLSGILLDASLIRELAAKNVPLGVVFSYKPDAPQKDLIFQPCCLEIPPSVRYASGRLVADTHRAMSRVASLFAENDSADLNTIGRWLICREENWVEPAPREVEIELTTDDPYPDRLLHPRGDIVGNRGPIEVSIVKKIVQEISKFDDALVVLGGFGEPLRHSHLESILEILHPKDENGQGAYGVAIRSSGVDLTEEVCAMLVEHGVDIVAIALDAWTADLYARLQSPHRPEHASLESVTSRMNRLTEIRTQRGSVTPLLLPEMCKAKENLPELDDFYDGWMRRVGSANLCGYSHFAGQLPDRSAIRMAPEARKPCRRIRSRCLILADGSMTLCDQDFRGIHAVGRIGEHTLAELWRGKKLERLRSCHAQGRFQENPMCARCEEWHRP